MAITNSFSFTKTLRSLTSKHVDELAYNLVGVFLTFGEPCVLQTDNGREFINAVINSMTKMHIVLGKSGHSQSQESV